ncbi:LAFE_0H13784g1_1 [Lachancea fermentati]|uniref:F-actin-capping protein subunit alpha n=1 Tax=Lachancea fermentati TaxID=4955 RepID=A0A1G4MKY2_LACFM|nr:LAFE_0H13784g1_1 [Lachancea fermentati]
MTSAFDSIICDIISSAPSGEIKEIYNDLKALTGNKSNDSILEAITAYNIENCIPVNVDGEKVIISKYNKEGSKFFSPVTSTLFSVNHLDRVGLDLEKTDRSLTEEQQGIYDDLLKYTKNSFPGDVTFAVYPGAVESEFVIIIVSTKYSPGNYWNGHWKSEYVFNVNSGSLAGDVDVSVHYFEDGNVSFKFSKDITSEASPSSVVTVIRELENELEKEMNASFTNLNEKEFKLLRRRLPVTRSKINWGKGIGNYRLGKDSSQSQI